MSAEAFAPAAAAAPAVVAAEARALRRATPRRERPIFVPERPPEMPPLRPNKLELDYNPSKFQYSAIKTYLIWFRRSNLVWFRSSLFSDDD